MCKTIYKYKLLLILLFLLFVGCEKDTSPITSDNNQERPLTGEATLTGTVTGGTEPVDLYVMFYNDYRDTLAHVKIDTINREYRIENLPEDTVDLIFTQPFQDRYTVVDKIIDTTLHKGINTIDHYLYFGYYVLGNERIHNDHFVVKFDSTYQQTRIDSFNAQNNILSVSIYEDFFDAGRWHKYFGKHYHFLEIDPQRDVFQVIDTYMMSDLTIYAYPVFDQYPDFGAVWWVGYISIRPKQWINDEDVYDLIDVYKLSGVEMRETLSSGVYYDIFVSKETNIDLLRLKYLLYFNPAIRSGGIYANTPGTFTPPPWE